MILFNLKNIWKIAQLIVQNIYDENTFFTNNNYQKISILKKYRIYYPKKKV